MSDTKILQALLDGQVAIREDIKKLETNLTQRIDKLGMQLANVEDDSPTRDELDGLDKRVVILENRFLPT